MKGLTNDLVIRTPAESEDLLPPLALAEIRKVLEYGAEKYSPWGWRDNSDEDDFAAANRHIAQFCLNRIGGQHERNEHNEESGLHHFAHSITRQIFILDRELAKNK